MLGSVASRSTRSRMIAIAAASQPMRSQEPLRDRRTAMRVRVRPGSRRDHVARRTQTECMLTTRSVIRTSGARKTGWNAAGRNLIPEHRIGTRERASELAGSARQRCARARVRTARAPMDAAVSPRRTVRSPRRSQRTVQKCWTNSASAGEGATPFVVRNGLSEAAASGFHAGIGMTGWDTRPSISHGELSQWTGAPTQALSRVCERSVPRDPARAARYARRYRMRRESMLIHVSARPSSRE